MEWETVRQRLETLCTVAGVAFGRDAALTWHWMTRRTGATRLARKGVPVSVIQRIGGWQRPDVPLAIYVDTHRDDLASAVGQRSRSTHGPPVSD